MVNRILAFKWIKGASVRGQSYDLAAWCRDNEKECLDTYYPNIPYKDTNDLIDKDPSKSVFEQYKIIREIMDTTDFKKYYDMSKFNIDDPIQKEFAKVVREDIINKILE